MLKSLHRQYRLFYTVIQDECGEWVTALCPYAETGCPDNEGDYDVVMPEPLSGLSGSGYKVRVADVNDEESADCSDDFFLLASEEVQCARASPVFPYFFFLHYEIYK